MVNIKRLLYPEAAPVLQHSNCSLIAVTLRLKHHSCTEESLDATLQLELLRRSGWVKGFLLPLKVSCTRDGDTEHFAPVGVKNI